MSSYDPTDPLESGFLSILRQGESGGNYEVGYGPNAPVDLSSAPTGAYGFPIWTGNMGPDGTSHAAGAYQFEPSTWQEYASKLGLNFGNSADQDQGAWALATQRYSKNTGGGDLRSAIAAGDWSGIQSALGDTWTSLKKSDFISRAQAGMSSEVAAGPSKSSPSLLSDPVGAISSYFVRGSMIFVGAVVLAIALWALVAHSNIAPKFAV